MRAYVRCNNTRRGGHRGLAAVQKESHEPTTPSLGPNRVVRATRQNGRRRRTYPRPHTAGPTPRPRFPTSAAAALTAFAAKAAAMPVIRDRSRRLVRPHSLLPPQPPRARPYLSRPAVRRRSESTDRRERARVTRAVIHNIIIIYIIYYLLFFFFFSPVDVIVSRACV